jgi:hypothetical protein
MMQLRLSPENGRYPVSANKLNEQIALGINAIEPISHVSYKLYFAALELAPDLLSPEGQVFHLTNLPFNSKLVVRQSPKGRGGSRICLFGYARFAQAF